MSGHEGAPQAGHRQDPRLVLAPHRQPAVSGLGPGAWEAGGPAVLLPWMGTSQSDPTLPKREKASPFVVAFTDPGLPGWGKMRQERVGCQPGSEVAGMSVPWGQMVRSYRPLGQLPSLRRRNFHPLLKEKRSQWPTDDFTIHSAKLESKALPVLAPSSP